MLCNFYGGAARPRAEPQCSDDASAATCVRAPATVRGRASSPPRPYTVRDAAGAASVRPETGADAAGAIF